MIVGTVSDDDEPILQLSLAGQTWPALVDTGFNGDLELPERLYPAMNARYLCQTFSLLAAGQTIVEDTYLVDFPFDGQIVTVEATFVQSDQILLGTHFLRGYRLEIHFVARTVLLERVTSPAS